MVLGSMTYKDLGHEIQISNNIYYCYLNIKNIMYT